MERKITALKAQKRDQNRVSVFLDGEYAFGLSRIVAAWLQVGQVLTPEKVAELRDQDARETAYQRALKLLSYRDRSEAEIQQHLQQKGIPEEVVASVIARLRRSDLVNDKRFAQLWVENRAEFRPRSKRALAYELKEKGIDRTAIEEMLENFDNDAAAYDAAHRYVRKLRPLAWPEFRQKLYGFLARRGFDYDAAKAAIERVWAEQNDESSAVNTTPEEEVDL
jgi:regulatory protein